MRTMITAYPHYANKRIIDAVANSLNLNGEQVCINIFKYGDTTSATIPLAISEAYQNNMMQKGDRIILVDFGAGFTGVLLKWAL
ncbi:3-oxoacyl-[acyl-carrier-protein] synthase III C-terminal domain-containing protein [Desulfococcaceae bacterium HSG9]|nr:3-oxoacyl-[acyl-carrier-protein] synthase III C-terminal domain-containing protein [Desulfococcaceae bacterium HSG9]